MATREQHPPQETRQGEVTAALFPTISALVRQAGTSGGFTTASSVTSHQDSPVPGQDQPQAYTECYWCSAKFSSRVTALRHKMEHELNSRRFRGLGGGNRGTLMSKYIRHMTSQDAQRDFRPHHSYTPYTRWNSPADLNLPRRSHRQTAGVSVATQEGTLAEARPSFSAEDMSRSLSSVVKSSQDSSTGRSFGDMSEIRAALPSLVKSSQDSSRGSGLGDMSEIRAALPAVPATSSQQSSSMELKETTGTGYIECINCPRRFADWSQEVEHIYVESHRFRVTRSLDGRR